MGGHEGAFEFVFLRVGFDEGDVAALVAVDEVTIDVSEAGGFAPDAFFRAPFDVAGFEFNADGLSSVMAVSAVDVAIDEDHASVVVLEGSGFEKVDFFGGDAAAFGGEFDEGGAGLVSGGAEDKVAIDDGGGDVGSGVSDAVVAPQEVTIAGADANDAAAGHLDILFNAAAIGNDHGAVASAVFAFSAEVIVDFGFPLGGSGFFVERNHEGFFTAGSAEDAVAIDEGGLREAPTGHHFAFPFFFEVLGPDDFSFGGEAGDDAVGGGDVEVVTIDGGDGAGALVSVFGDVFGDRSLPEKFAVLGGKGGNALAAFEVTGGVNDAIGDGDGGEAFACSFDVPKKLGWGFLPVLHDALFGRESGAVGTTPLGPVFGVEKGRVKEEGSDGEGFHCSLLLRRRLGRR